MSVGSVGSEGSVLGSQHLQQLRNGGKSSGGQSVVTAPGSVRTEAEVQRLREEAAERVANGELSLKDEVGVYGRDNPGRPVPPKTSVVGPL